MKVIANPDKAACCIFCFLRVLHCRFFRHCSVEDCYNIFCAVGSLFHKPWSSFPMHPRATICHPLRTEKPNLELRTMD